VLELEQISVMQNVDIATVDKSQLKDVSVMEIRR